MDGFELYIKIKEKDPTVKICFLTAIATFDEEFRKSLPEVDRRIAEECFIQKPITMKDLIKKLIRYNEYRHDYYADMKKEGK